MSVTSNIDYEKTLTRVPFLIRMLQVGQYVASLDLRRYIIEGHPMPYPHASPFS